MKVAAAATACLALGACATSSANISSGYSSPMLYGAYSCRQLGLEDQELLSRVSSLRGQIDRRATNDKIAMGVAVVAFWPAVFFVKGDGEQAADYARLKGEHEAISHAAALKGCLVGGAGQSAEAAYPAAPPLQPYQPVSAAVSYAQPAPFYPLPTSAGPPTRIAGDGDGARPGRAVVDNYGRDERP